MSGNIARAVISIVPGMVVATVMYSFFIHSSQLGQSSGCVGQTGEGGGEEEGEGREKEREKGKLDESEGRGKVWGGEEGGKE